MQRMAFTLLGIIGVVAVALVLLLRLDARQASQTGPKWKRRLLAAGLILLGVGTVGCRDKAKPVPPQVMCYAPTIVPTTKPTAQSITQELDLIEKQIPDGQLPRDVVEKRLDTIAGDARLMAVERGRTNSSTPEGAKKAADPVVADEARASRLWAAIHADPRTPLGASEDWRAVLAFWHFTQPLGDVSTLRQRFVANEMHERAKQGLKSLSDKRLLDANEAGLLALESDRLVQVMSDHQPIDWMVMCYDMIGVIPARESLDRLSARAGLLEGALKDGRIEPAVAERILDTIKTDLAVLGDEKKLAQLNSAERAKAKAVSKRVAASISKLETNSADR